MTIIVTSIPDSSRKPFVCKGLAHDTNCQVGDKNCHIILYVELCNFIGTCYAEDIIVCNCVSFVVTSCHAMSLNVIHCN